LLQQVELLDLWSCLLLPKPANGSGLSRRPLHSPEARCGEPERGFGGFNPVLDGARQAPGAGLWGLKPVLASRGQRAPTTRRHPM